MSLTMSRIQTRRRTLHGQRGVALIEALMSILIFSLGVLGLMGLEARAINFSVDAEDRNRASLFANDVASYLWLTGNVTPSAAQITTWQTNVANASATGLPNGTFNLVNDTPKSAVITITWKPPSRTAADSASTLTTRVILP
jgi:type IV pilus assembly protein PilV